MAEPNNSGADAPESPAPGGPGRSQDEVALELMKFIAVATGIGKAGQSSAGFSGKPVVRTAEEQIDALLGLFERCRKAVRSEVL